MSTLSLIPEEKIKMLPNSSKSTESLYSSSSSKYSSFGLFRRKAATRQAGFIPATNEVRQRVLSARRLRVKTLQNQLADAQQHIAELAHENRILRTLHKRQDSALAKYESTNAELPQLLHSHAEEIRVWQTKYRNVMSQNKELASKLKQKDAIILSLSDQNKHLNQLNKDKHLEDRERLSERVRYLEGRIMEKDNDLKLMARRLQLESKNFKSQLQGEHGRYKDVLTKLEKAKNELATFGHLDPDNFDKIARNSLIPRYLSSATKIKTKTDSSHNISLPPAEGPHLQPNINSIIKSDRELASKEGYSPKLRKNAERSSAPASRRPSLLTKLQERRNQKKDELAEAIQKGIDAFETGASESSEEDQNHDGFEQMFKQDKPEPAKIKDYSESDESDDDFQDNDDYDEDTADVIVATENKEDHFESIRKQMSDDYKEHESFLDSFCNQSTEEPKKEQRTKSPDLDSIPKRPNIDPKKKVKLLAALKAIDETKSEDDK